MWKPLLASVGLAQACQTNSNNIRFLFDSPALLELLLAVAVVLVLVLMMELLGGGPFNAEMGALSSHNAGVGELDAFCYSHKRSL